MAFFDEVGKKIAQTGQGVAQSTKNMTETIKLNGMISDEEKSINNIYLQMGKLYYETYKDNPDPLFVQMVTGVNNSKAKITSYGEQIKQMKGIIHCPNCGAETPYNDLFCSTCGMTITKVPAQANTVVENGIPCNNCGAVMQPDKVFCTKCGNKMEPPAMIQPNWQMDAVNAPAPPVAPIPAGVACPTCGAVMPANKLFCTNCGCKIESVEPQVNQPNWQPDVNIGDMVQAIQASYPAEIQSNWQSDNVNGEHTNPVPSSDIHPNLQIDTNIINIEDTDPAPIVELVLDENADNMATEDTTPALSVDPIPDGVVCPGCGAIMPPDKLFCTNCGGKIEPIKPPDIQPNWQSDDVSVEYPDPALQTMIQSDFQADVAYTVPGGPASTEIQQNFQAGVVDVTASIEYITPAPAEYITPTPQNKPVPDGVVCSGCGAVMPQDKLFCTNCGGKIEPIKPPDIQPNWQPEDVRVEYPNPAPQTMIQPNWQADAANTSGFNPTPTPSETYTPDNFHCPACGIELPGDSVFCYNCGQRIGG